MDSWAIRQKCWDNGIYIVQKPIERGYTKHGFPVKLNLVMNKKIVKFGSKEYKQNSRLLEDAVDKFYREVYRIYLT